MAEAAQEMATSDASKVPNLGGNPLLKQLGAMVGIAVSVALGVSVVMWSQTPNYSVLDTKYSQQDAVEVMDVLQQSNIVYKIDPVSGAVLVESGKLQDAKLKLAAAGLPKSAGVGFELMTSEPGFGVSQLVEKARHQRAIEGELARTIATINAVQSARVHLAIPKQSVFVRKRQAPSASVTLKLFAGRKLQDGQIDAIVHMVASSVAELEAENVTVVDQKGNLLSNRKGSRAMQMSDSQFEYVTKLEEKYRERVYDLLAPIVGEDKVRVQVVADVNFSITETTSESFNPHMSALRSEQVNEEKDGGSGPQGVPGALSNQPGAAAITPEGADNGKEGAVASRSSKQAVRNYEVEKTISHTQLSPASLRKLSVAVVVDDRISLDAEGAVVRMERTPEEIDRLTQLVSEAIGFDTVRGDTVKIVNSSFLAPDPIAELPEVPLWEQSWFWDIIKQVGGVLVVILLILMVLRPAMKRLTSNEVSMLADGSAEGGSAAMAAAGGQGGSAGGGDQQTFMLGTDHTGAPIRLPGPGNYESILEAARKLVDEDPKRVAQLVKSWNVNH
jgi:flagellar M-ring protein FliF